MLKLVKDHSISIIRVDLSFIKKPDQITLKGVNHWQIVPYSILLLAQIGIWYLLETEVLVLGYGWDGRMLKYAFTSVVGIQLISAFIIQKIKPPSQQKSLYQAHYVLFAVIGICLFSCLEIHYKWQ